MNVTNITPGRKVVNSMPPAILLPGETMDLAVTEAELAVMQETGWFDIAGAAGEGDDKPTSLSGKTKAELLEIAATEGVDVEDGATVADIKAAIELHREAAAA